MNRDTPIQLTPDKECSVKAFDGADEVVTFRCAPWPACGKWLAVNPAHKSCEWCGQAVRFVNDVDAAAPIRT